MDIVPSDTEDQVLEREHSQSEIARYNTRSLYFVDIIAL